MPGLLCLNYSASCYASQPRLTSYAELQQCYADYDAGRCTKEDLIEAQDAAVQDTVERLERSGQDFVTDGEQRCSSFATYPVTE